MDRVVFRRYGNGEIIALFPDQIASGVYLCNSYMHVGQHGAADYTRVVSQTKPAKPEEYQTLATELAQIGYKLETRKRYNWRG